MLTDKQQEQFDLVCQRIADGLSLRKACEFDDVPTVEVIRRWLNDNERNGDGMLVAQYARAREEQADAHADEIVDIADNPEIASDHKRVMVDSRKWIASKLRPKRYGDRVAVGGEDGGPLKVVISRDDEGL